MINIIIGAAYLRMITALKNIPGGADKAMKSVISRTNTTVKSESLKQITSVYDIKSKDVRDRDNSTITMRTLKTESGIVGEVKFSGGKIPLYRFGVKPKTVTPKENQNVSVRQLKSSPLTRLDNAFVAKMKSGHMGVFERKPGQYMEKRPGSSKHSEAIGYAKNNSDQFYGSSTPEMARNTVVLDKVETVAEATVIKRTEHEINRILKGYGG